MDNNHWSDSLKRRMESHTETPPARLWDEIERRMEREAVARRVRRRRALSWSIGSGVAAAVALLLVMVIPSTPTSPLISAAPSESATASMLDAAPPAAPPVAPPDAADTTTSTSTSDDEKVATQEAIPTHELDITREALFAEEITGIEKSAPAPDETPSTDETPSAEAESPAKEKIGPRKGVEVDPSSAWASIPDIGPVRARKQGRWHAGLFASNIMQGLPSGGSSGSRQYDAVNNVPASDVSSVGSYTFDSSPNINTVLAPEYSDIEHKFPVTVGLSLRYALGERWSVSSGVTYSMLSSRIRTGGGIYSHSGEQTLHYIGIPLGVDYTVWRTGGLSIYLSAGGAVEKSVSGNRRFTREVNGDISSEQTYRISDRLQWSLTGSAGVGYDFTKVLGIYAEPGVNYYFDNGSDIETIRKARPLNFGLRLGLRFSL